MKKLVALLIILLVMVISLGKFFDDDACFINAFINEFDTTINIVAKPEKIESNINEIQKIANKNNISFIKEVYEPKNTRYEKQKINIYIYLNEAKWFEKSFKNISITENFDEINKFKTLKNINLLTAKDVNVISYSNIKTSLFDGDYHIKGKSVDIKNFVNELNDTRNLNIEATIDTTFSIASELTQKQAFLYIVSTLILIASLMFSFVIYNGDISKEISIISLLGHDKKEFSFRKTIELLGIPILISLITTTIALYFLVKPDSVVRYVFSMKKIYFLVLLIGIIAVLLEFLMIFYKTKRVNIISCLKGYRQSYNKSSMLIKTGSIAVVLYLLIVSVFGLCNYIKLKPYIANWDKSKNYANISCTWPWSYVKDDEKFEDIVVPKLNNLWDTLEAEGAILFDAPNIKQEGMFFDEEDEEHVKQQAFNGQYTYINKNYLRMSNLVDKDNKPLSNYEANEGEWLIFVPENIKITDSDKRNIRDDHIGVNKIKQGYMNEVYIPIKKGQLMFSFDSQKRLDEPNTLNYILIMVDGKNLDPTGGVKLPSLVNGKFHPYISDSKNAYDNLKPIIEKTDSAQYILYITSVYDEVASKVDEFKIEALIYFMGFILSLLILSTLLKIDKESYFYNHGQRIYVSRLLGYDFMSIHKSKILQNGIIYLLSIVLLILAIIFTGYFSQFGFFVPRDGWTNNKLLLTILIAIICVSICFSIEIIQLKKNEKNIVIRLKDGC
ncbi:MAG: hypothetical protein LBR30_02325 [Clostridioides sp.]|jgi:hypothetical protein|nr:hypothetical protein [Clostridioides sp.]